MLSALSADQAPALVQVLGFMVLISGTSVYNELLRAWLPDVFSRSNSLANLEEAEVCLWHSNSC